MAKPLLIIFARAPKYGAVKSRLARDIGAGEALRFYRHALGRVARQMTRDSRFATVLAVTPDHVRAGYPAGVPLVSQGAGDLGQRMVRALRAAGTRRAALIGSDIPDVRPVHIAAALGALGRARFVLGAAPDGGYWLIGARHPMRLRSSTLNGVRWSSPQAMRDTIERLGDVAVLDTVLDDIDDGAAYRALRDRGR
jgi:hypothetical protein